MADPAIIRLLCDASKAGTGTKDINTDAPPEFWRGNSVTFELGLKKRDGSFLLAADVGTLIVQVKNLTDGEDDAAIMHKSYGTGDCDGSFTADLWDDGEQLVAAAFTIAEAALDAGDYYFIVRHQDADSNENTYCKFLITCSEDQADTTNISPPTPPTGTPISQETADGRYAEIALETTVADKLYLTDGVIRRPSNIASLLHRQASRVVVTGDSLAYNRYDYDTTSRATAEDGQFGYKSWSYLLRDAMHANLPGWIGCTDILALRDSTATIRLETSGFGEYWVPFDGRYHAYKFNATGEKARFLLPRQLHTKSGGRSTDDLAVFFFTETSGTSGTFTLRLFDWTGSQIGSDTTGVSNSGTDYNSWELVSELLSFTGITNGPVVLEIECTAKVGGNTSFRLMGTANSDLFWKNTGDGGETTSWLLANIDSTINDHNPDVVIIIIGANDIIAPATPSAGDISTFESNLDSIVGDIRTNHPYCEIIFVGLPPTADTSHVTWDEIHRKRCHTLGAYWVSLIELFRYMDPTDWMFDTVHFTKLGNQVVFESVVGTFAPTLEIRDRNQFQHVSTSGGDHVDTLANSRIHQLYANSIKLTEVIEWDGTDFTVSSITYDHVLASLLPATQTSGGTTQNNVYHSVLQDDDIETLTSGGVFYMVVRSQFEFLGTVRPRLIGCFPMSVDEQVTVQRTGEGTEGYTYCFWIDGTQAAVAGDLPTTVKIVAAYAL